MTDRRLSRRALVRLAGAGALALGWPGRRTRAAEAGCEQLSGRQITWIVPASPGGGYDTYSRLLEPFYEARLGAEIIIRNIATSGSVVTGAHAIASSLASDPSIGLLNASGLLIGRIAGDEDTPNPGTDFTLLGRMSRSQHVWTTGAGSRFDSIDDVIEAARHTRPAFAISEVASSTFVSSVAGSRLLGIEADYVAGYAGSRVMSLALIRGEVDVMSTSFYSVADRIESGDLRPLLQVSSGLIDDHPALEGVPVLGGETGVAAAQTAASGLTTGRAVALAGATSEIIGAGRIVAAPLGLDPELASCLERALQAALTDPGFRTAAQDAGRPLHLATGEETRDAITSSLREVDAITAMVQEALERVRS